MNDDSMPARPSDTAINTLVQHWRSRTNRHAYIASFSDSLIFTESGFAGAAIVGRPYPPAEGTGLTLPATPAVLGVTFTPNELVLPPQKFILPAPPIAIATAWKSHVARIADGSRNLDDLGWKEFEDLMAEILERSGWSIIPMGYTKDGGVDIIAVRNLDPGVPIELLVQCKRYKKNRRVGVNFVKELWATKSQTGSHQAMLASTSSFTRGARTAASLWKMDLRDYDAIRQWCIRLCQG